MVDNVMTCRWVFNTIGIVIGVVFEISLLMYTAVRSAVSDLWNPCTVLLLVPM